MPKNPEIKKVLVIGSGPIVIGQAAGFKSELDRRKYLNIRVDSTMDIFLLDDIFNGI